MHVFFLWDCVSYFLHVTHGLVFVLCILCIPSNLCVPSWEKKKSPCLDIHLSSLSAESSGRHASPFSPYFSFRSVKRRDFPGNVSLGGCDSLLLVLAPTSKQHDSLLGYVLHFLYIRSCRLCRHCTTGLFCLLVKNGAGRS